MSLTGTIRPAIPPPLALLCGLLLTAAFGFSLFMHSYNDIHYAPALLLLLACGGLGQIPAIRHGLALPSRLSAILILSFWSYAGPSLSWSSVPYASQLAFCIFSILPLAFFAVILSPRREDILRAGSVLLGLGFSALALWGLTQYFMTGTDYGHRAQGPLLNPNNFAALLNLALLPALAACLYVHSRPALIAAFVLFALFYTALLATESRGAFLAFTLAAATLLALARKAPTLGKTRLWSLAVLLIGLFVLMSLSSHGLPLTERLAALLNPLNDRPALDRIALWQATGRMIRDHLWTGTGFGSFFLYYPAYRLPGADASAGWWAHNDPLQFWAETGIAAPLLFYLLLAAVLAQTLGALHALPAVSARRPVLLGSFCALLTLALHSHLTFNLYVMAILLPAGFLLAAWYCASATPEGGYIPLRTTLQKSVTLLLIIAFTLTLGVLGASTAAGAWYTAVARRAAQGGDDKAFLTALQQAERFAPESYIEPETELAAYTIRQIRRFDTAGLSYDRRALIDQTRALLDTAQTWNPAWAKIDALRARLALLDGDDKDQAIIHFTASLRKNPMQFEARRDLATLHAGQNRLDEARTVLAEGQRYPRSAMADLWYAQGLLEIDELLAVRKRYGLERKPAAPPLNEQGKTAP